MSEDLSYPGVTQSQGCIFSRTHTCLLFIPCLSLINSISWTVHGIAFLGCWEVRSCENFWLFTQGYDYSCVPAALAIFPDRNHWRYTYSIFQPKRSWGIPVIVNRALLNHPHTVTCLSVTESDHWDTKLGGYKCLQVSQWWLRLQVPPIQFLHDVVKKGSSFIWPHPDKLSTGRDWKSSLGGLNVTTWT